MKYQNFWAILIIIEINVSNNHSNISNPTILSITFFNYNSLLTKPYADTIFYLSVKCFLIFY